MRVLVLTAATLVLAGCGSSHRSADPNTAKPPSAARSSQPASPTTATTPSATESPDHTAPGSEHPAVLKVGGTATSAHIKYSLLDSPELVLKQDLSARIPWTKTFHFSGRLPIRVSARNDGSGTVTCEIDIDGVRVKAAESSGKGAVASCDYDAGT